MDGYIALWTIVRRSVVARTLVLCALLAPPSVTLLVLLDTMPNVIVPHVGNGLLECSQFLDLWRRDQYLGWKTVGYLAMTFDESLHKIPYKIEVIVLMLIEGNAMSLEGQVSKAPSVHCRHID